MKTVIEPQLLLFKRLLRTHLTQTNNFKLINSTLGTGNSKLTSNVENS